MNTDANAPGAPELSRIRGPDGIRALSVLAIIAFHTGLSSVPGWFLRRRFVLRPVRIPDHVPVGQGVGGHRNDPAPTFLGRSRPPLLPALFLLIAVIGIVLTVVPGGPGHAPHPRRRALDDLLRLELVFHHAGASDFTLPPSRRLCCTRGRWRSRSSSTWCGRWWCSACSRSARHTGDPAARGPSDSAPASAPHDGPTTHVHGARRRPVGLGGAGARPGRSGMGPPPAAARSLCGRLPRFAGLRAAHGAAGPQRVHQAAPTTARTPGRRRCWSAPRSPSGWRSGATEAAARGSPARPRCSPWPVLPGPQCCGPRRRRPRRSPSVVGSCWPAWRRRDRPRLRGGAASVVVRLLELPPLPQRRSDLLRRYLWYWPVVSRHDGATAAPGPYPLFLARVAVTVCHRRRSATNWWRRRSAAARSTCWRSWVAAPVGAAIAVSLVCVSMLVPVGAAELQGTQLTVSAPPSARTPRASRRRSVKTSAATATLAGSLSSVHSFPARGRRTRPPPPPPPRFPRSCHRRSRRQPPPSLSGCCWSATPLPAHSVWAWPKEALPQQRAGRQRREALPARSRCRLRSASSFTPSVPNPPCDAEGDPNSLFDTWRTWVDEYNPDVVVYLGRCETFDQEVGGQWQNLGEPGFDATWPTVFARPSPSWAPRAPASC